VPVLQTVHWFNQLVTTRVAFIDERGDTVARAMVTEILTIGADLPLRLDALADSFDGAMQ
jgi:hypothetical protein